MAGSGPVQDTHTKSETKPGKATDLAYTQNQRAHQLVDVLRAYLNRGDLLHDLQETGRQLAEAVGTEDTPGRSVKTITREGGGRRKLSNRLTDDQVREMVVAFEAGTTRMELAKRYGIGRTSVAELLREWREKKAQGVME
jgi:hypothetical protein